MSRVQSEKSETGPDAPHSRAMAASTGLEAIGLGMLSDHDLQPRSRAKKLGIWRPDIARVISKPTYY